MRYLILALGLLLLGLPARAEAKVNVFACEPEWGALAKEIGGDQVEVYTASTASQNVHFLRAKPSLLAAMRKTNLVFCSGASLEIGWLPVLIQKAGGPDVQQETVGWLMAADYVDKLDIPEHVDRSMGDVHPEGNPHVQLDPNNILTVAEMLADRLYMIDPNNAASYQGKLEAFKQRWQDRIQEWNAQAASLKGKKVVVYHNSWSYLLNWLGIGIAAQLEPKPGIPPTASHLEKVLSEVTKGDTKAILVAPFEDSKAAEWLSSKTGIPIVELPFTVGGNSNASNLESLFNETIRLLREALA
ncbi:MAG: metal ABC transporter substrate-binding protein [Alphaproteobacteria bacterium]